MSYRASVAAAYSQVPGRGARIAQLYHPAVDWHGPHPIGDGQGRDAMLRDFWLPLLAALPDLERRDEISLAGQWQDALWIASTGHYAGLFATDWLGIPATGRFVSLHFGEFVRWHAGQVVESYMLIDILDLLRQIGSWPLAPALGAGDRVPGPATSDGVLCTPQDAIESRRTLELVEAMIGGLMEYDRISLDSMKQWRYWARDFTWYGPAGIGTCRGQEDYRRVHQGPFLRAFPDRVGGNHKCRIGEGVYAASTGWPSIRATHAGGDFLGLAPTGKRITMRVMDFWRREQDLLKENWVFIDLLDLLAQMGVDVLARLRAAGALRTTQAPGLTE